VSKIKHWAQSIQSIALAKLNYQQCARKLDVCGIRTLLIDGSQCVHCGEPDSARITGNPEVMPLDQYRDADGSSIQVELGSPIRQLFL
jgi:ribosomal protein L37E